MVKKTDWMTMEMPEAYEVFSFEYPLAGSDIELLKMGILPVGPKDDWFVYSEDNKLYIHRSRTGYCIYIITIKEPMAALEVCVNRNPEQYMETDYRKDARYLTVLLNLFVGQKRIASAKQNAL